MGLPERSKAQCSSHSHTERAPNDSVPQVQEMLWHPHFPSEQNQNIHMELRPQAKSKIQVFVVVFFSLKCQSVALYRYLGLM